MLDYSSLPYDILHQFCLEVASSDFETFRMLSLVNKRTRSACIPLLFHSISHNLRWDTKSDHWQGATEAIETLQKNPTILDSIRNVRIQPQLWMQEQIPFPHGFFDLIFSSLDKLIDLKLVIHKESTESIKALFNPLDNLGAAKYPPLPHVKSLTIRSRESLFFLASFPAITSLEIISKDYYGSKLDFETIALTCPSLKRLHCPESGIKKNADALARWLPGIEDVGFHGDYNYERAGADKEMYAFGQLKHLKTLNLPDASMLRMGFDPPECGNAYFNNPGLEELLAREEVETIRRLIDAIERDVMAVPGSKLSQIVVGSPQYGISEVWEKGSNGKLSKIKLLHRESLHGKIIRTQDVVG